MTPTAPRSRPADSDLLIGVAGVLAALAALVASLRMEDPWGEAVQLLLSGAVALALLVPALRAGADAGDRPSPRTSALLLAGLAVWALASYRLLALVLSDEPFDRVGWVLVLFALVAAAAAAGAWRTRSASALLIFALLCGGAVLAGVEGVFTPEDDDAWPLYVLAGLSVVYALVAAVVFRGPSRHRDVMVGAAGLAVAGIGYFSGGFFGFYGFGESLPWGWEAFMLAGAVGLILYTARTGAPGPGVLALFILAIFVLSTIVVVEDVDEFAPTDDFEVEGGVGESAGEPSLLGWPLALAVLAAVTATGALLRRR